MRLKGLRNDSVSSNKNTVLWPFGKSTIIPIQNKFCLFCQIILFQDSFGKIIPGHGYSVSDVIDSKGFVAREYFFKDELGYGFSVGGRTQLLVCNAKFLTCHGLFKNGAIEVVSVFFTIQPGGAKDVVVVQ